MNGEWGGGLIIYYEKQLLGFQLLPQMWIKWYLAILLYIIMTHLQVQGYTSKRQNYVICKISSFYFHIYRDMGANSLYRKFLVFCREAS
jgi:hypothetical protein